MQPISAIVPAYFAMLAGNEAARIRQGPIEVLVTPDVDAALALNRHAQWTAVRQARVVLDSKRQAHRRLLCGRSSSLSPGPDPSTTASGGMLIADIV